MFEDFINNCAMESKVDTSNEQIEADTAAVFTRIKTSEKAQEYRRASSLYRLSPLPQH